ncbi:hypothetical protein [Natronococcus wangiae]|uniref:hypothetical protein n=1 Tax=Natronococcus wangiae TaxID=3068275 RepID=UPI00273D3E3C|nr:hypothetical protein [Natronococcus sp. AD5]
MRAETELSVRTASSVQEAIDAIVQAFDYPERLSVEYASADGRKATTIEIERDERIEKFELEFRANEPNENPVLKRLTEDQ